MHDIIRRSIRNLNFYERVTCAATELKHCVNSQRNVNHGIKKFSVSINAPNPVMCCYKTVQRIFRFFPFYSLSKYINPAEDDFFPTSEYQAMFHPLGVLACF